MKKEFKEPQIELVLIDTEDIIKTSTTEDYNEIPDGKDYNFG